MYKQSPSRNNKSKGIKVKHILQICVLVAICFWLLYQINRSHEKRKEFESKDENSVAKLQSDNELQRFGRKDIPKVTEIATNVEKHDEDEDDKEDEEDKDHKHEEDETEREDARSTEKEEERGGGDDEMEEREPEKIEDEEADDDKEREEKESVIDENHSENEEHEDTHEEEHLEEEEEESDKEDHTESEESYDVNKEDHGEREIKSNDHDRDVGKNTREAQEELYRADDASSEVAQNVKTITQENGNVTTGQANDIYGKINFGQEHELNTSKIVDEMVEPHIQLKEDVDSTASDATITEQNDKVNLTKADDGSLQNSTTQQQLQNSTLPEIPENSTVIGEKLYVTMLSNGTHTSVDLDLSQIGTIGIKQATYDNNQKVAGEDSNNIENVNTNKTLASSDATNHNEPVEAAKDSLGRDEGQGEKPENVGKAGTDESSVSRSSEGREIIQHDEIDSSDTAILTQEEKESRTDLDTLPEIKSEVHDKKDVVAE